MVTSRWRWARGLAAIVVLGGCASQGYWAKAPDEPVVVDDDNEIWGKTPDERVAEAEAQIRDMEKWSRGEATVDAIWAAERELAAARREQAAERARRATRTAEPGRSY
jgi:hypothetical protein